MPTLTEINAALNSDLPTKHERFIKGFPSCRAVVRKLETMFEEGMTWENAGTYWKIGLREGIEIPEGEPVSFSYIAPVRV